jgi:3-phenylpropionate/cinnamic acid dioxygenase small subunit
MDVQQVADKLEIHELLARYARGVDTKDWALYRSVFTPDAAIDYSSAGAIAGTRDEVAAWLEAGFVNIPMTQHFISNIEIELDGDHAKARAMFYNPMQLPGMSDLSYCGGYYDHELVRTTDGWKSERLVEHNQWFVGQPGETTSAT